MKNILKFGLLTRFVMLFLFIFGIHAFTPTVALADTLAVGLKFLCENGAIAKKADGSDAEFIANEYTSDDLTQKFICNGKYVNTWDNSYEPTVGAITNNDLWSFITHAASNTSQINFTSSSYDGYATIKVTLDNQSATTAGTTEYYYKFNTYNGSCYYFSNSALTTCLAGAADGTKITIPTRTGYTFGGYYTDKNGAGTQYVDPEGKTINNIYKAVDTPTTLYAKWTRNVYTITLNNNGATIADVSTLYIVDGKVCTDERCLTTITTNKGMVTPKKQYTVKYNVNADDASVSPESATAAYTFNGYTVTYKTKTYTVIDKNGRLTSDYRQMAYDTPTAQWTGTPSVKLPMPTRSGYTFTGWSKAAQIVDIVGTAGDLYTTNKNITLYAMWEAMPEPIVTFDVANPFSKTNRQDILDCIYDNNCDTWDLENITVTTADCPSRNSTYSGQIPGENQLYYAPGYPVVDTLGIFETCEFYYGLAEKNPSSSKVRIVGLGNDPSYMGFDISLNKNGGTSGSSTLYTRYNAGVYTDANLSKSMSTSANAITKPTSGYTVKYNANGGSVSSSSATANRTFNGYYSAATGGTQYVNANGYITTNGLSVAKGLLSNATWYAQWGAGTVTLPTPTRTGYTFKGWRTSATGGTFAGNAGANYTVSSDTNLYAQWEKTNSNCTPVKLFVADGDTDYRVEYVYMYPDSTTVYSDKDCDKSITELPTSMRAGMSNADFSGFYNTDGEMCVGTNWKFTGDCQLQYEDEYWDQQFECHTGYWSYANDDSITYASDPCDPLCYEIELSPTANDDSYDVLWAKYGSVTDDNLYDDAACDSHIQGAYAPDDKPNATWLGYVTEDYFKTIKSTTAALPDDVFCTDSYGYATGNCDIDSGTRWVAVYKCNDGYTANGTFVDYDTSCSANVYKITLDSKYYASSSATNGTNVSSWPYPDKIYEHYNNGWYEDDGLSMDFTSLTDLPIYETYVFAGFFTGKAGTGTQVIASDGRIIAPNFLFDKDTTIFAHYISCTCNSNDESVSSCSAKGTSSNNDNACYYTVTCADGYSYNGFDDGERTFTETGNKPGVPNYTPTCKKIGLTTGYICPADSTRYISCYTGKYMATMDALGNYEYNGKPTSDNSCQPCPADAAYCPGGTSAPLYTVTLNDDLDESMVGTLYANVNAEYYKDLVQDEETGNLTATRLEGTLPAEFMPTAPDGKIFNGYWTEGGEQYIDANGNFLKGPSADVTLHAQWTQCAAGTYEQDGVCVTCPKGSYCANGIKNSCSEGTYADKEGMTECTACPSNSSSTAGKSYCNCKNGFSVGGTGKQNTSGDACTPTVYEVILDNKGADTPGTEILYKTKIDNVSKFYKDKDLQTPITQIEIPTKRGHTFVGYAIADSAGAPKPIREKGHIDDSASYTGDGSIKLYAIYQPDCYAVELKNTEEHYEIFGNDYLYGNGNYYMDTCGGNPLDSDDIDKYTFWMHVIENATFAGYYSENNENSTQCVDENGKWTGDCSVTENTTWYELFKCNDGYTANGEYVDGTKTQCAANVYTVNITYDCGDFADGTAPEKPSTCFSNVPCPMPSADACGVYPGHTFKEWEIKLKSGNKITVPADENVQSYINAGETGGSWSVTAQWTPIEYTITYNLDGGELVGEYPTTYNVTSSTITLANATKTGYTFGGWYDNSGLTGTAVTQIATGSTGNKTFWAKWTIMSDGCVAGEYLAQGKTACEPCKVGNYCAGGTFNYDSTKDQGINACSGATQYQNQSGQATCKTVSDGYYKKDNTAQTECGNGYYCKNAVRTQCPNGYVTDTTTASLESECYTACTVACTEQTCPKNAKCTHGTTTTNGKQYVGSTCNAASSTCDITISCNNGYDLDGSTCVLHEYTITYELDGGVNAESNPAKYSVDTATITLANPSKDGYTFGGWYSDANFTTKVTQIATGSTGNKTFWAKWTTDAYTITYELDGGVNAESNPVSYDVTTDTITLADPSKTGYTFGGWYSDANFATKVTQIVKGSTGDKTLYAKWTQCAAGTYEKNGTCTPCAAGTFSAAGANVCTSCPAGKTTKSTGQASCVACSNNANVDSWNNSGSWNSSTNATVTTCSIKACKNGYQNLSNACSVITYNIKYYDGSTELTNLTPTTYNVTSDTIILAAPTKTGYDFVGWFNKAGEQVTEIATGSTGNIELIAQWKAMTFTCKSGEYLNVLACEQCPKGYKCPQTQFTYNKNVQGLTACSGTTEYQDQEGQTTCKTVSDGYYKKDNTAQTECGNGYYCKNAVRTVCPDNGLTDTATASDVTDCYKNNQSCTVNGGFGISDVCHYDTTKSGYKNCDVCIINGCSSGYYKDNNTCTICPQGSYCANSDKNACPDKYTTADTGATQQKDCFTTCDDMAVEYGIAHADNATVSAPLECSYSRGESVTGNPCDIKNGKCVETSCKYNYEMKGGKCTECVRDNARTFKQGNGNCVVESCEFGYYPDSAGQKCMPATKECTMLSMHAIAAQQTWDTKTNSYTVCQITECADGYHISNNTCISDEQTCNVPNGIGGVQTWNGSKWSECVATKCKPGYTNDRDLMWPAHAKDISIQCGRCDNAYDTNGAEAAHTYVRECEIATCMYQGKKYILENNECRLICNAKDDETGSRYWDSKSEECVHTCNAGYQEW